MTKMEKINKKLAELDGWTDVCWATCSQTGRLFYCGTDPKDNKIMTPPQYTESIKASTRLVVKLEIDLFVYMTDVYIEATSGKVNKIVQIEDFDDAYEAEAYVRALCIYEVMK